MLRFKSIKCFSQIHGNTIKVLLENEFIYYIFFSIIQKLDSR